MTAAKVTDVIARLPDCAGQAADAASAYTQVKMEDAPRLLASCGKDNLRRFSWNWCGKKVPNWECLFVHRKTRIVLVGIRGWHQKCLDRKKNMAPMWKKFVNLVDLWEPTSFLDHVYVGCTQLECKPNEDIVNQYGEMSNHEFLQQQLKSYQVGRNLTQRLHKLSWNVCMWHELVDLTFFGWETNLLEESQHGQELVANAWLVWFLTFITQMTTGNIFMCVITAQHCRLGFVSRLRCCWRPWRFKNQHLVESYVSLKVNICSQKLDVQEANVSVSQFHRIGNYFFGCWFANGWNPCPWFVGCGDRSVTFVEQQEIINPGSLWKQKRIQGISRKLLAHV